MSKNKSKQEKEVDIEELIDPQANPLQEETAKPAQYKTTHNGAFIVGTVTFAPGETKSLDDATVELGSTQHAIKTGLLVKV